MIGDNQHVPTPDRNTVAGSVTAEQVDAVMLAAQALVGVTVQSLAEFETVSRCLSCAF